MKLYLKKVILLSLMLVLVITRAWPKREVFTDRFSVDEYKQVYQNSSYNNGSGLIEDWDLYALAGHEYLVTGNLSNINVEHPPLGKYLIGLSLKWWGNPVRLQILFGAWLLANVFWLAKKQLKGNGWSWLVTLALFGDGLFLFNLTHSMLDMMLAVAISSFFLSKNNYLKGFWLGVAASVKYPVTAVLLGLSWLVVRLLGKKNIKKISLDGGRIVVVGVAVFLLSYSPLFLKEGVRGFFRVQERAVRTHLSHVPEYPMGGAVRTLVLNQWPVWFDSDNPIHSISEWNILWAIATLTLGLSLVRKLRSKNINTDPDRYSEWYWFAWIYFLFINSRLFFPNYLFLGLPYWYLIAGDEIKSFTYKKVR